MFGLLIKVVEFKAGKIADKDVLGQFVLFKPCKVIGGLFVGAIEVFAKAFMLYQQGAFPKEVYEPLVLAQFLNGFFKRVATRLRLMPNTLNKSL